MLDALKATVSPLKELEDRVTALLNPFWAVTVKLVVAEEPCVMVRLDGFALSEKSGWAVVIVMLDAVLALPVWAVSPV